ncbi:hypothetical protein MKX03_008314 [Papaver bracteatum]|nr:hypothetical protein MKX03_008314 [Papaver bracteatum]
MIRTPIYRQKFNKARCSYDHTHKLKYWRDKLSPRQLQKVEEAGFGQLSKMGVFQADRSLITTFLDRWRHETNTFHLPNFEATITLQDVVYILGLNVIGVPVFGTFDIMVRRAVLLYLGK